MTCGKAQNKVKTVFICTSPETPVGFYSNWLHFLDYSEAPAELWDCIVKHSAYGYWVRIRYEYSEAELLMPHSRR